MGIVIVSLVLILISIVIGSSDRSYLVTAWGRCIDDCDYRGGSYKWCKTDWGTWSYCSEGDGYGYQLLPYSRKEIVLNNLGFCLEDCEKWHGSEGDECKAFTHEDGAFSSATCNTGGSWGACRTYHKCDFHGTSYPWCFDDGGRGIPCSITLPVGYGGLIKKVDTRRATYKPTHAQAHVTIPTRHTTPNSTNEYCQGGEIIAVGEVIKLSEVALKTANFTCGRNRIREMKMFAFTTVIIDEDIVRGVDLVQLTIISPVWQLVGERLIDLSGNNGVEYDNLQAADGKFLEDGESGRPGKSGVGGSNFLGLGHTLKNTEGSLMVRSNGGSGASGQSGGNGGNGEDSIGIEYTYSKPIINFELSQPGLSFEFNTRCFFEKDGNCSCNHSQGCTFIIAHGPPGHQAGRGGHGGKGGLPGKSGKVIISSSLLKPNGSITVETVAGTVGKAGLGGKAGTGGRNGGSVGLEWWGHGYRWRSNWQVEDPIPDNSRLAGVDDYVTFDAMPEVEETQILSSLPDFYSRFYSYHNASLPSENWQEFIEQVSTDSALSNELYPLLFFLELETLLDPTRDIHPKWREKALSLFTNKLELYLKQPQNFSVDEAKFLNFVYFTALGTKMRLQEWKRPKLVTNIFLYFEQMIPKLSHLNSRQKQLERMKSVTEEYRKYINGSITQAHALIHSRILPEIKVLQTALTSKTDELTNEVVELKARAEESRKDVLQKMQAAKTAHIWKGVLTSLTVIGGIVSFIAPLISTLVGAGITGAVGIGGAFAPTGSTTSKAILVPEGVKLLLAGLDTYCDQSLTQTEEKLRAVKTEILSSKQTNVKNLATSIDDKLERLAATKNGKMAEGFQLHRQLKNH